MNLSSYEEIMIKKLFLLFLIVLLSGCYSTSNLNLKNIPETPYDNRLVIAVIDFQNKSGDPDNDKLMKGISGTMLSELQNSKHFRLIERQKLKSILEELSLSLTGLINPDKAKKIGKLLGVDALLFGSLSSVKYAKNKQTVFIAWTEGQKVEISLDARLVNVKTGEILAASKSSSYVKQRNWVAFWFARIGQKTNKSSILQTGIDLNCKQLANDIANRAPVKSS